MKYRAEIDGLRALAVIPVILFHAGFTLFSGGYIGVDVFFVISGYLITTILIEDIQNNRFSIVNFYERRARRILPALLLVMLACIPFAWMWMLPEQLKGFSDSLFTTSLGLSNLYFMSQQGYFGLDSETMPLLHTWSLGVEEQYYILFPILLYVIYKRNLNAIGIVLALTALSLAVSEWGWRFNPDKNYFFTFSRLWELGVGTIVALVVSKHGLKRNNIFALSGLGFIVFAIFTYDKTTPFPSVYTLVPIIGVVLLILFAEKDTLAARLLSSKLLVGIGIISYSAYLWHQPLFAFARIHSNGETNTSLMIVLSLVSILLAYFSWKYIEKPYRDKTKTNKVAVFSTAVAGVVGLTTVGIIGHLNNGFEGRISDWDKITSIPTVTSSYCHNEGRRNSHQLMKGDFCTIGKGQIHTALIGDSHAGALFDYADSYFKNKNEAVWAISGGFCAPLLNGFETRKGCRESTRAAFEKIIQNSQIKDVILVAEWSIYTKGYRGNDLPKAWSDNLGMASSASENSVLFKRSLVSTITQLREAKKNITIVMPVPEFHYRTYDFIAQQILVTNKTLKEAIASVPEIPLDEYYSRNKEVFEVFDSISNDVQFVHVSQLFCNEGSCSTHQGGELPLFSDFNHVNQEGAKLIVNKIFDPVSNHRIVQKQINQAL